MTYDVSILPKAKVEVLQAAEYYHDILPELSNELLREFFRHLDLIAKSPLHYQIDRAPYRKVSLHKFPYKIVYTIVDNHAITVVAFAHHKRKSYYWEGR